MFNIVILSGRLTADAELKYTTNNKMVTSFTIATQRKMKNANGNYDTDFINIVAWGNTAEFISKHFCKGNMIGIEGSIQTRKYEDKDGNKRTAFEVVANNVQFIESKKEETSDVPDGFVPVANQNDDDLPF